MGLSDMTKILRDSERVQDDVSRCIYCHTNVAVASAETLLKIKLGTMFM